MLRHLLVLVLLILPAMALGQMNIPSQGYDGVLTTSGNMTIDLDTEFEGTWDSNLGQNGNGIYDAEQWAVVYHYDSVNIAAGDTLRFLNHRTTAPVVWLVSGDVTIEGVIDISGKQGRTWSYELAEPGPGGFPGGRRPSVNDSGAGFGPGGGALNAGRGGGGGYGTNGQDADASSYGRVYGTPELLPLIGGSGGGASYDHQFGGGAGGGAIFIASSGTIQVNGAILAAGGAISSTYDTTAGCGSGGGIKLVASEISGMGIIDTSGSTLRGYDGGAGRIRMETQDYNYEGALYGEVSTISDAGDSPQIWPDVADISLRITSINGVQVSEDPDGNLTYPHQDLYLDDVSSVTVDVEALNLPGGASVHVVMVRKNGQRVQVEATGSGNTYTATFTGVGNGMRALQALVVND